MKNWSCWLMRYDFFCCYDIVTSVAKYLTKLRKGGLFCFTVPGDRAHCGSKGIMVGTGDSWSHYSHRKKSVMNTGTSWLSLQPGGWYFLHVCTYTPYMDVPLLQNPSQECPELIFMVNLDPIKLTININHSAWSF